MKILHVYRGYGEELINTVIDNQIRSLNTDKDIIYRFILNKGGIKYFTKIYKLKCLIKKNNIDIIHAHYSFSGFMAGLTFSGKPIVCSLMGSDVYGNKYMGKLIAFFIKWIWTKTIVKSAKMQKVFNDTLIISNGVNLANFSPKPIIEAFERTCFNTKIKNIIFIATNPYLEVKNH